MRGDLKSRKAGTAMILGGLVCGMIGVSFAAVPLYRVFCEATGYNGTTQRAAAAPGAAVSAETITVRFDASTSPELPWEFRPVQSAVTVHPGEQAVIAYRAVNKSQEPVTGTATFNVTPYKAGIYFNKVQCFCFSEQHLEPGQSADLAVAFFVDPDMLKDADTRDVKTITLSYTMFRAKGEAASQAPTPLAQRRDAVPDAGAKPTSAVN
jgi:cytochrome c oxidase assembly protein subunit 11